jgi:non-heme chloroperoxidase
MGRIDAPTLIGVGTKDDIAGSPQELAALMPNAEALDIPGRDHMLAVGDRVFKKAVLEFYAKVAGR